MSIKDRHIKNIFVYSAPSLVGYTVGLITMPIMTRLLTPMDYGIVAMSLIFPVMAVSVFALGSAEATRRSYFVYRTDEARLRSLVTSTQVFLFMMFLFSCTVVFLFKDLIAQVIFQQGGYGNAVMVAFVATFLGRIVTFYLNLYQCMERAKEYAFFLLMQMILGSAFSLFYVWFFKLSYMGPLWGSLTAVSIVGSILFFRFNVKYAFSFDRKVLFENISYGLQLVPKSFTGIINKYFDKYMLNSMLSLSAVGVYNIGQNIGLMLFNLVAAAWNSFQPVFYKEAFDRGPAASQAIGRLFTLFSYLTLSPIMLVVLFSREIIFIMAPPSYYGAVPVIIIVACAFASNIFGAFIGLQYAYSKKAYLIFPITIVGTIINVAANILLIPKLGIMGAAFATLITYIGMNGILVLVGQRLYKVAYEWKFLSPMYLSVLASAFLLLYLHDFAPNNYLLYAVKVMLGLTFLFVGYKSNIMTKEKISRVIMMFQGGEKVAA
ncbi:MAG: polysaccharide biosynthesis protein [Candidatus Saganbacteria bacterium]|nr:polysaccharide biosynthesis protein [Candidatus Saganbacteria bacterium]